MSSPSELSQVSAATGYTSVAQVSEGKTAIQEAAEKTQNDNLVEAGSVAAELKNAGKVAKALEKRPLPVKKTDETEKAKQLQAKGKVGEEDDSLNQFFDKNKNEEVEKKKKRSRIYAIRLSRII